MPAEIDNWGDLNHLLLEDNDDEYRNRRKRKNGDTNDIDIPSEAEIKDILTKDLDYYFIRMGQDFLLICDFRAQEDDRIWLLLPSITKGVESAIPKNLDHLIEEAMAIKKHLSETHSVFNKHSEFLLYSIDYVIHMVSRFSNETAHPAQFDWESGSFPKWAEKLPWLPPEGQTCTFLENALKLCERGADFVSHLSKNVKAYDIRQDPWCLRIHLAPVADLYSNGEGKNIWLEFKEFDKGNPIVGEETSMSIALGHPIVSVIGDFAVAAFNKACEMHVKKKQPNNLHDFEIMECTYKKRYREFEFFLEIEAVEEENLGVYQAEAVVTDDGMMLKLSKFALSDRKPIGTKVKAISVFSFLRSACITLRGVSTEKDNEVSKMLEVAKGRWRGLPWRISRCISVLETETITGLHQLLDEGYQLIFSPDCSRITNPDYWSYPENKFAFGTVMVLRDNCTPCRGYDYFDPTHRKPGEWPPS